MSKIVFRRQEIVSKDKKIVLEQKSIEEIFKFDSQPYIIVGVSGCGKTTLCLDIMYKFAEKCTSIYYVTSTKESIKDDTINQIPIAFRRKPTFENLNAIWQEIMDAHDAAEANESKLNKILVLLCGQEEAQSLLKRLEDRRQQIQSERKTFYVSQGNDDNEALEKSKNDSKAFYIDTLSKLILDRASTKGTGKLSIEDMNILSSLVSPYPKVLLLMDDVSAELNDLKTKSGKVIYKGQPTKISEAYKNILMDILTRGRHYGVLVCLFLHTIDLIPDKSLINNLIILNKEASKKVRNARSFPDEMKDILDAVVPIVFTPEHKFCFFSISQLDGDIGVGKADLHYGENIPLSKINREYVKAVDSIYSGINAEYIGIGKPITDDSNNNNNSDESDNTDDLDQFTLDKPM